MLTPVAVDAQVYGVRLSARFLNVYPDEAKVSFHPRQAYTDQVCLHRLSPPRRHFMGADQVRPLPSLDVQLQSFGSFQVRPWATAIEEKTC